MNQYLKLAYLVAFTSAVAIYGYLVFASLTKVSIPDPVVLLLMATPAIQLAVCMVGSYLMD
jgi:hypothetical protein